jgi:hypothetical protein
MRKLAVLGCVGLSLAAGAKEMPLADCSGLPCVSVDLGQGRSATLMIDTGNNHGVLDIELAKSLGLELKPYVSRSGKTVDGLFTATLSEVKLGGQSLGETELLVTDVKKDVAEGIMPKSEGTLSYVSFKDRVLTLDYRRHTLSFTEAGAAVPAPAGSGDLTYPTFGRKGPPIVVASGFSVNGKPVSAQIDTLYSGSLLIYAASVDKLGLAGEAASTKTRRFAFTDGGVDMIEGKADREAFAGKTLLTSAGLYFPTPDVHQPDGLFDGTVGAELFARHRLTLDFHANKVWLD